MRNRSYNPSRINARNLNTVREATARLLATENITVIQDPKAPSAYFDLKSRTLALPIWRDMTDAMYDMLVGHEVGHALYTPNGNGGWVDSAKRIAADAGLGGNAAAERVAQSFLNVVEDARIERLIKNRYPGLRRDFFTAYTEFAKRDIFELRGRDPKTLPLIDRLNLYFKIGFNTPIHFTPAEQAWIARIDSAVTWEDVVAVASDLFRMESKGGSSSTPTGPVGPGEAGDGEGEDIALGDSDTDGESGEGSGTPAGSDGNGESGDEPGGESGSGDSESDGEGSGKSGSEGKTSDHEDGSGEASGAEADGDADLSGNNKRTASNGKSGHGVNTAPVVPQDSTTAKSLDQASASMRDLAARGRNYVYLPKIQSEKFVIPFSDFIAANRRWESEKPHSECLRNAEVQMKSLVEDTRSAVQSFVREFEMLKTADEHRRTVESKSGRLDMDQAWKYRISEDLFKVATTMRDGKNHGFVMFIDWSGSMSSQMEQTMRQLYILFQFCRKVGIPFDVYAFGVGFSNRSAYFGSHFGSNENEDDYGVRHDRITANPGRNECTPSVELLHILSSRGTARDIQDGFRYCLAASLTSYYDHGPVGLGGSTPLDSTIVVARDIVNQFRKQSKVQIVNTVFLTDGDATDHLLSYTTKPGPWSSVTVLRDGHREWASETGSGTGLLLQWFRDQTQANTLGIFVTHRFSGGVHHMDPSVTPEVRAAAESQFKSEGWCSIPALGFDNYFMLRGQLKDSDEGMKEFLDRDTSGMSATQIKTAYIKAIEKRNGNRGMIHRMVKIVA